MFQQYLFVSGILIQPMNAGLSFSGTYCNISSCDGLGLVYCDSGCCDDFGVTLCCPNSMMIVMGSILGFLFGCMLVSICIVFRLQRRRRKLQAFSKYRTSETQTLDKPPKPDGKGTEDRPKPKPPSQDLMNILQDIEWCVQCWWDDLKTCNLYIVLFRLEVCIVLPRNHSLRAKTTGPKASNDTIIWRQDQQKIKFIYSVFPIYIVTYLLDRYPLWRHCFMNVTYVVSLKSMVLRQLTYDVTV